MSTANYHIYDSAIVDAPIEEVWAAVRDMMQLLHIVFGDMVKDCQWVDGGSAERIPSRFKFTLTASGETPLEEVAARSEIDHSVTYRMIGAAVGIEGYVATYRLRPITNEPGRTFVEWPREFAVAPGQDAAKVVPFLTSIASQEVAALRTYFQRRTSR